jgi:hypothetical protein
MPFKKTEGEQQVDLAREIYTDLLDQLFTEKVGEILPSQYFNFTGKSSLNSFSVYAEVWEDDNDGGVSWEIAHKLSKMIMPAIHEYKDLFNKVHIIVDLKQARARYAGDEHIAFVFEVECDTRL